VADMENFNEKVINEFRANGGKVGGRSREPPSCCFTTSGQEWHRTGEPAHVPAGRRLVRDIRLEGRRAEQPGLVLQPGRAPGHGRRGGHADGPGQGAGGRPGRAGPIWEKQKSAAPGFAEYETNAAPRQIPVIVLDPVA